MRLQSVRRASPAYRAGLRTGMVIRSINGEPVRDFIDWSYFTALPEITVEAESGSGIHTYRVENPDGEDPGMVPGENLYPQETRCQNRCIFCFIDQLPQGMRKALYVKDDDWRYSLMFGNYVSLTNLSEEEFHRILKRKVSPLYVSVHATQGDVRARLMGNPKAAGIMEQLRRLAEGGIAFHAQVVLCPGYNDGEILDKTLADLASLRPMSASVAVVPLGLTCRRERLTPLLSLTKEDAERAIDTVEAFAQKCLEETGERFVYASDEMYWIAGRDWPRYGQVEGDMPQWGNGVALFDNFLRGIDEVWDGLPRKLERPRHVTVATGTAAAPTLTGVAERLCARIEGLTIRVTAVKNHFFGETIQVAGLLTGGDIAHALRNEPLGDAVLIPEVALQRDEPRFLDDMTLEELTRLLGVPVLPVSDDGGDFARKAAGCDEEEA